MVHPAGAEEVSSSPPPPLPLCSVGIAKRIEIEFESKNAVVAALPTFCCVFHCDLSILLAYLAYPLKIIAKQIAATRIILGHHFESTLQFSRLPKPKRAADNLFTRKVLEAIWDYEMLD